MPFIPHTAEDDMAMLAHLGLANIDELFTETGATLAGLDLTALPEGLSELEITRLMQQRQPVFNPGGCFIGAGAYEHHIPAAVWQIATRGEFYTAYTPYQAEASQGSLQLIYEFQTLLCRLFSMEVANASLYDGATALAEAVLMALRVQRDPLRRTVLVPTSLHPRYRDVLNTTLLAQGVKLIEVPWDSNSGCFDSESLVFPPSELAAVIIPQPNFFGVLDDVDKLTQFAHQQGALAIAVVNPLAMALLKPPGEWGDHGADIVCGEGQPLGIPLASGGPYFGFMCSRQRNIRQMPGRIVGRTTDSQGRGGFVLTLQAREQHIRRSKATSNICTNQGLMVVAASIYLSLLGPRGLRQIMLACVQRARLLRRLLTAIPGVELVFNQLSLHEFVIRLPRPAADVIKELAQRGLQAGYALGADYPGLEQCLLVCATETKTSEDLLFYQQQLAQVLGSSAITSLNLSA